MSSTKDGSQIASSVSNLAVDAYSSYVEEKLKEKDNQKKTQSSSQSKDSLNVPKSF
jgi:uncharacterized membrane protein YebE (DUF533 family)